MRRGFTLVEVLVVLVILAVVIGFTAPAFARMGEEDERTTASRELVDLLRLAHKRAVELGVPHTVILDPGSARYWMLVDGSTTGDSLQTGTLPLAPGVALSATRERVSWVFDPRGPAHGDSVFVRDGSDGVMVGVDRWTGVPYVR